MITPLLISRKIQQILMLGDVSLRYSSFLRTSVFINIPVTICANNQQYYVLKINLYYTYMTKSENFKLVEKNHVVPQFDARTIEQQLNKYPSSALPKIPFLSMEIVTSNLGLNLISTTGLLCSFSSTCSGLFVPRPS